MKDESLMLRDLSVVGTQCLREYSYSHGKEIARFIDQCNWGKSDYGRLMDAAGSHKLAHRLFGHHPIADFPLGEMSKTGDFVGHLLSDLFTRQGLPILPGELLQDMQMLKACNRLTENWNFLNGFDLLSGTVAIFSGGKQLLRASEELTSLDTAGEIAREFGIGTAELLVAISTCNPLLLIGAALQLTSAVRGILNDGSTILINRGLNGFTVDFQHCSLSLEQLMTNCSVETEQDKLSAEAQLDGCSVEDEINDASSSE
jgi:hypothetical protein